MGPAAELIGNQYLLPPDSNKTDGQAELDWSVEGFDEFFAQCLWTKIGSLRQEARLENTTVSSI